MLILNIRASVSLGGDYKGDEGTCPPTFGGTTFWLRPDPHHSEEIAATVQGPGSRTGRGTWVAYFGMRMHAPRHTQLYSHGGSTCWLGVDKFDAVR